MAKETRKLLLIFLDKMYSKPNLIIEVVFFSSRFCALATIAGSEKCNKGISSTLWISILFIFFELE